MCEVLNYSRSTFYDKLKDKKPSKLQLENKKLQQDILSIYNESSKIYGAPKICSELKKIGYKKISLKRVQRHMTKLDIKSIVVRKFRPYKSNKVYENGKNLLNRDFATTSINQKWVSDITYINTLKDGWCYLASIMDLHTKKIIGYSFSKNMTTDIVIDSLNNAIKIYQPKKEVIIHSDRGSQYTSKQYRKKIQAHNFKLSYSGKGCPYDNACIESFHAILKKECVYLSKFYDFLHAKIQLFEYIEGFYNRKRIHSSLGYSTTANIYAHVTKEKKNKHLKN